MQLELTPYAIIGAVEWVLLLALWVFSIVVARRPDRRDRRIAQLEADHADLLVRITKLTGRVGRQVRDERAADEELPLAGGGSFAQRKGESAAEWKMRTRALIQRGVKP